MGCLLALLAVLAPRIAIVLVFLLTNWLSVAFEGVVWPVLGFIFMPYTTPAWTGAVLNGGVQYGWALVVLLAVIVDLAHLLGGGRRFHTYRGRRITV